ncbi:MAG: ribose-5-phosphate isomerase RpiA, partial [Proteobacteria bacterium]|nr:ribose-5-phosphate isomerase RpiA [Pseudomonadota bacterium]
EGDVIGTGSTAAWFVKLLAGKQSQGLKFRACATSSQTTELAESLGIKIESLDDLGKLDLVIDGADEFGPAHQLIKGGGGALLQEKMTARSAKKFIVITDSSKEVSTLGRFPLPVEIVQFAWQTTRAQIGLVLQDGVSAGTLGGVNVAPRMAGDAPFITDEGHYILDLELGVIADAKKLDNDLRTIAGVVETGLFLDMADVIVMADGDGLVESKEAGESKWEKTRYELAEIADMLPRD